ncbi:uncharacterized protein Dwil_GK27207 [Drosophila willistoni]|uniref:Thioredoxin-like fold domain-containing protein n=1 Tax=Drosophila willistoni TaxID=7260 RepID=A0A0Q9X5N9_DROWI|nr:gamma-interferon-inducible lysosomal thiol reductase [Drosophila willistoni]KRG00338.1 uncharacterized protein Dwil_GK27207 [Drosophila willistoni]
MIAARKQRWAIIILVIFLIGLLLRIIFFNTTLMPLTESRASYRQIGMPVLVVVYYEALCPDSKFFITKQLLDTYKVAADIMEVQLVPYGKATTKEENGKLSFDCQHGALECQANVYHACAVESIGDPLVRIEVVTCMIRDNRFPKEAMLRCAEECGLEDKDRIQKCVDSSQGTALLKLNGEVTHALRPSITFIPTITIDGSQGRQPSILKNLLSEVCKAAGSSDLANKICKKNI